MMDMGGWTVLIVERIGRTLGAIKGMLKYLERRVRVRCGSRGN